VSLDPIELAYEGVGRAVAADDDLSVAGACLGAMDATATSRQSGGRPVWVTPG
jgi:hypothetical protein